MFVCFANEKQAPLLALARHDVSRVDKATTLYHFVLIKIDFSLVETLSIYSEGTPVTKNLPEFLRHNTTEVWRRMRNITGFISSECQTTDGDVDRANGFNLFFNRFDKTGHAATVATPPPSLQHHNLSQ